jgi:hypothetical protein
MKLSLEVRGEAVLLMFEELPLDVQGGAYDLL